MRIFARPVEPEKRETVSKDAFLLLRRVNDTEETMNTARAPEGAKIGWIGLGKMGLPICERLAAHAFPVTALTRSTEHREQATQVGVRSASGIAGVVDARRDRRVRLDEGPPRRRRRHQRLSSRGSRAALDTAPVNEALMPIAAKMQSGVLSASRGRRSGLEESTTRRGGARGGRTGWPSLTTQSS